MFGRGKKPTSPKVAENAAYLRKHPEVQVALDAALNACLLAQGRAWPRELDPIRYIASAMRVGPALRAQLAMMDVEHLAVASTLADIDQDHLFKDWPAVGTDDDAKRAFFAQAAELDSQYPGGLRSYYENAKACLAAAKAGENPFEGWTPEVPTGERLEPGSERFLALERVGVDVVGHTAFVLVAGGLGERLGYSGIKIALPCDSASGKSFFQWYAEYILALQQRAGGRRKLQLAIMTSDDTHDKTMAFLEAHNYCGLTADQVTLMKQEKVPSLGDNAAHFVRAQGDKYALETKPHGHGDVHSLLWSTGIATRWKAAGVKYVVFFQDTNALAFRAVPALLGVSVKSRFVYNSLTVPRTAGEAVGGIARLRKEDGTTLTVNVEYNQLDPLLRATINPQGDTADESGHSPFPGNINVLAIELEGYHAALASNGGRMPEFVNPKYKGPAKDVFQKPTRLECMMQDLPKVLPASARVGFTQLERWVCFSAVKNNVQDAAKKAKAGLPPECAATGEADMYYACAQMLRSCGMAVEDAEEASYNGVPVRLSPQIHLAPSFAVTWSELLKRVRGGSLSARASLVVSGDVTLKEVVVDGALILCPTRGASIKMKNYRETNTGWTVRTLHDDEATDEVARMRGYVLDKAFAHMFAYSDGKDHTLSS